MPHHRVVLLRRRADHLRDLARRLESSAAMGLDRATGVDTWFGPRADACDATLRRAQRSARDAVDELCDRARLLDDEADLLEERLRRDASPGAP